MAQTSSTPVSSPSPHDPRRRVAAIDIGTNSIHLVIVAIDPKLRSFTVLLAEKSTARLGERDSETGSISPQAIERGFEALRRYQDLAEGHGVEQIVTAATSAVREAPNGPEFLETLRQQLSLEVDLVSGIEEARLIYLGVLSSMAFGADPHLILDIGGGSTELILADGHDAREFTSTRIGAVRLQREFMTQDPLSKERRGFLRAYIQGAMDPAMTEVKRKIQPLESPILVATSGTALAIATLAAADDEIRPLRLQGYRISRSRVDELVARLVKMSPEQRRGLSAINERRAEIIVPGALILQTSMAMLQVEELVICERALREGLIVDWMLRHNLLEDRFAFQSTIRRRTVVHLAHNYGVDLARSERVASHALSLYDQTRGLLHHDEGGGRQLLWAAALLHSCGMHVNMASYHKHTWYLIRHGELLGYSQAEQLLVAAIARYHRRGLPKKRHEAWQLITDRDQRRCVLTMALLLRLAAALDRRPSPPMAWLKIQVQGVEGGTPKGFQICLGPSSGQPGKIPEDLSLERWSLASCASVVLEATGLEMDVKVSSSS